MFVEGHQMITIINSLYEGGLYKFKQDGGVIVPYPDDKGCFLYDPSQDDTFKEKLMRYNTEGYEIILTDGYLSYDRKDLNNFLEELLELEVDCAIHTTPLALYITFKEEYSEELFDAIKEIIGDNLPNIKVSAILFLDQYKIITVNTQEIVKPQEIKKPIVLEEPKRNTVIKDDDITDLKIALETLSVDDFIKSI